MKLTFRQLANGNTKMMGSGQAAEDIYVIHRTKATTVGKEIALAQTG